MKQGRIVDDPKQGMMRTDEQLGRELEHRTPQGLMEMMLIAAPERDPRQGGAAVGLRKHRILNPHGMKARQSDLQRPH